MNRIKFLKLITLVISGLGTFVFTASASKNKMTLQQNNFSNLQRIKHNQVNFTNKKDRNTNVKNITLKTSQKNIKPEDNIFKLNDTSNSNKNSFIRKNKLFFDKDSALNSISMHANSSYYSGYNYNNSNNESLLFKDKNLIKRNNIFQKDLALKSSKKNIDLFKFNLAREKNYKNLSTIYNKKIKENDEIKKLRDKIVKLKEIKLTKNLSNIGDFDDKYKNNLEFVRKKLNIYKNKDNIKKEHRAVKKIEIQLNNKQKNKNLININIPKKENEEHKVHSNKPSSLKKKEKLDELKKKISAILSKEKNKRDNNCSNFNYKNKIDKKIKGNVEIKPKQNEKPENLFNINNVYTKPIMKKNDLHNFKENDKNSKKQYVEKEDIKIKFKNKNNIVGNKDNNIFNIFNIFNKNNNKEHNNGVGHNLINKKNNIRYDNINTFNLNNNVIRNLFNIDDNVQYINKDNNESYHSQNSEGNVGTNLLPEVGSFEFSMIEDRQKDSNKVEKEYDKTKDIKKDNFDGFHYDSKEIEKIRERLDFSKDVLERKNLDRCKTRYVDANGFYLIDPQYKIKELKNGKKRYTIDNEKYIFCNEDNACYVYNGFSYDIYGYYLPEIDNKFYLNKEYHRGKNNLYYMALKDDQKQYKIMKSKKNKNQLIYKCMVKGHEKEIYTSYRGTRLYFDLRDKTAPPITRLRFYNEDEKIDKGNIKNIDPNVSFDNNLYKKTTPKLECSDYSKCSDYSSCSLKNVDPNISFDNNFVDSDSDSFDSFDSEDEKKYKIDCDKSFGFEEIFSNKKIKLNLECSNSSLKNVDSNFNFKNDNIDCDKSFGFEDMLAYKKETPKLEYIKNKDSRNSLAVNCNSSDFNNNNYLNNNYLNNNYIIISNNGNN